MELIFSVENVTVDFTAMQELLGGDYKNYVPVIKIFLENIPSSIHSIQEGILTKNWETIYKAAHFAKSSLAVIKINNHYEMMQEIEVNAKGHQNLEQVAFQIHQIAQQWTKGKALIIQWLEQIDKAHP